MGVESDLTRFLQSLGGAFGTSLLSAFETWSFQTLSQSATTSAAITNALVAMYDEIFLILAVCVMVAFGFALLFSGRVRSTSAGDPEAQENLSERSNTPSAPTLAEAQ